MEQEEKQLKEYYENAGLGLKKMWIGGLGALICTVLVFIPGLNLLAVFFINLAGSSFDFYDNHIAFKYDCRHSICDFPSSKCEGFTGMIKERVEGEI